MNVLTLEFESFLEEIDKEIEDFPKPIQDKIKTVRELNQMLSNLRGKEKKAFTQQVKKQAEMLLKDLKAEYEFMLQKTDIIDYEDLPKKLTLKDKIEQLIEILYEDGKRLISRSELNAMGYKKVVRKTHKIGKYLLTKLLFSHRYRISKIK